MNFNILTTLILIGSTISSITAAYSTIDEALIGEMSKNVSKVPRGQNSNSYVEGRATLLTNCYVGAQTAHSQTCNKIECKIEKKVCNGGYMCYNLTTTVSKGSDSKSGTVYGCSNVPSDEIQDSCSVQEVLGEVKITSAACFCNGDQCNVPFDRILVTDDASKLFYCVFLSLSGVLAVMITN